MRILVCIDDAANPCPPGLQQWVTVEEAFTPGALGVDALSIAAVFTWGLASVLMLWALGYAIGAALKTIRLI